MNCTEMLDLMLDAAPGELAGRGDSALAAHVRECARCRAVADQLLADTRRLARSIERRESLMLPRRQTRRIPRTLLRGGALVTTLAAAALAFAMLRRSSDGNVAPAFVQAPINAPETPPTAPVDSSLSPAAVAGEAERVASAPPAPVEPQRFADAVAIAPVPVVPAPIAPSTARDAARRTDNKPDITVAPSEGLRAAVMRTNNPNINVVWLY